MSMGVMAALLMGVLFVALLTGLPVAFCLLGVAALFILLFLNPSQLVALSMAAFASGTRDVFIAIPLFILMAAFLESSGLASSMFDTMYKWFAGLRGGLAIGTIVMCTLIAAMTGVASTGVVMMGLLAYPEMMKRGYDKRIALGCIPAGGSLGPLIPPSVMMIIIADFGGLSVGKMFIGGVFPGLLMSFFFIVYIAVRCFRNPKLAPAIPCEERANWKEKFVSLRGVILPIILVILILGSIYAGVATPSEAAGVGAFGAFVCSAIYRRLTLANLKNAIFLTSRMTVMVLWLVVGGTAFSAVVGMTGVKDFVGNMLTGLEVAPVVVIIVMQLIGLLLGMFMDQASISIITLPLFMPVILQLGFDPLWFGLVFTINMIIGLISPPFAASCFYLKAIVPKDVTMADIYRSVIPYTFLMMAVMIVGFVWPPLLTWLPNTMIK